MDERVKRTEVYIMRPQQFEMSGCPTCGNPDPDWSEWQAHLWCPKCTRDFIPKHYGILDGPVLVNLSELLGIYFDTVVIATGEIKPGPNGIVHYERPSVL